MELLKLVIVDDEPILLQGLVDTYDWKSMGFQVVGFAQSGEQALEVIRRERPDVVLTDIRMKQITGLEVMETIQKEEIDSLFIVLSAYRDFEYAQQACRLGAFSYLLKPIEEEKLQDTMQSAYRKCMEQRQNEEKFENWEKLLLRDKDSFLKVVIQKYVQNQIPEEKIEEIFGMLKNVIETQDRFVAISTEIDVTFKIINSGDYEAARHTITTQLEQYFKEEFYYWKLESEKGNDVFIIKTQNNAIVYQLKKLIELAKENKEIPVIAGISKPYRGVKGIKRSYDEAQRLLGAAGNSGFSIFTLPEDSEGQDEKDYSEERETQIVNAVRRNSASELKERVIDFIYHLPQEEEQQRQYFHKLMLRVQFVIKDSYGMSEELKTQFENFYSSLGQLSGAKTVDVCYKILLRAIELRKKESEKSTIGVPKGYIEETIAYIEEHLHEDLSITQVAASVYLNPVYFGRVFKKKFQMTFKQYVALRRIEKAKRLLKESDISIANICDEVGISNPSYFSHLFKEHTGKLPSEYKKEYGE